MQYRDKGNSRNMLNGLKTLLNIVEAPFKKFWTLTSCVVYDEVQIDH